jgi:ribosomal protein S2
MGITNFNKDFIYHSSFGHKIQSTDPKTFSNLLGFRKGASIINIEKCKEAVSLMNRFVCVLFDKKKPQVLFVNFDEGATIRIEKVLIGFEESSLTERISAE